MMDRIARGVGHLLAKYIDKPTGAYETFSVMPADLLRHSLKPADILLVEGDRRISTAIKYLTQSTWSHSAFFTGDAIDEKDENGENKVLIEANLRDGVVAVSLEKYEKMNTRICRPHGLTNEDRKTVINFMIDSLGLEYDLKNIVDLARYLLPTPPVPTRYRRRMLALGSGDPTRAICSSLIAEAFQQVRYPILPNIRQTSVDNDAGKFRDKREIMHIRHHSLFAPRDFDLSPYFRIVKPTLEDGFNYRDLDWYENEKNGVGADGESN